MPQPTVRERLAILESAVDTLTKRVNRIADRLATQSETPESTEP
jgi:hypothetical protein